MENKDEKTKPKVFLSYSREDKDTLNKLQDELSNSGISVWADTSITPGADLMDSIADALKKSDFVIVLLSSKYLESNYCNFEMGMAASLAQERPDRYIIPILLDDTSTTQLPAVVQRHTWVRDGSKSIQDLVRQIKSKKTTPPKKR